ncbi:solute carrier family 2, facilitated glucose transporter member 9-like isoform X6 [Dendrobates tinctorius]|uniref:solute carrier family 2, facilitated glucose transporter member 9-like isoform X6 n=1 Tax=Dendrobates tinctorius TaxID=92724 RepID=UPI003CCA032E
MDNHKKAFVAQHIAGHLTFPLLAVSLLSSFGSSMLYGYNLAVVNTPSEKRNGDQKLSIGFHCWCIDGIQSYSRVSRNGDFGKIHHWYSLRYFSQCGSHVFGRNFTKEFTRLLGLNAKSFYLPWSIYCTSAWPSGATGSESPRYLLIDKSNVHATIDALQCFRGEYDVHDVIEEMQEEQQSLTSVETVSVCQLLRDRTFFWQILSVIVINMGMQLSGIDAIWFYTNSIFENAGVPLAEIPYTTVGTGAIEIIAGLIGCFTVEKLGRRPLIISGFSFMGFCCAGITVALVFQARIPLMHYASVIFVIGIIAGFCIGPAGLPFIMTGELFMQSHRPAAYIVGGTLNWLSNFTVGFVFPFLQMSAGAFSYLVFCGVCLFVAVYVYFIIPETKNKTFLEISEMFSTEKSFSKPVIPVDYLKLKKFDGYGALESSSLEYSLP